MKAVVFHDVEEGHKEAAPKTAEKNGQWRPGNAPDQLKSARAGVE